MDNIIKSEEIKDYFNLIDSPIKNFKSISKDSSKIGYNKYSNIIPVLNEPFCSISTSNIINIYYKEVILNDNSLKEIYEPFIYKYINNGKKCFKQNNYRIYSNIHILFLFKNNPDILTEIFKNIDNTNEESKDTLLSWFLLLNSILYFINKNKNIYYNKIKVSSFNNIRLPNSYKNTISNLFYYFTTSMSSYPNINEYLYKDGSLHNLVFSTGLIEELESNKIIAALYVDNKDYNNYLLEVLISQINIKTQEDINNYVIKCFKLYKNNSWDINKLVYSIDTYLNNIKRDYFNFQDHLKFNTKVKLFIDKDTFNLKNSSSFKNAFNKYFLKDFSTEYSKKYLNDGADNRIIFGDGKEFHKTYWKNKEEVIFKSKEDIENFKKFRECIILEHLLKLYNVEKRVPEDIIVEKKVNVKTKEAIEKLELVEKEANDLLEIIGDEIEQSFENNDYDFEDEEANDFEDEEEEEEEAYDDIHDNPF